MFAFPGFSSWRASGRKPGESLDGHHLSLCACGAAGEIDSGDPKEQCLPGLRFVRPAELLGHSRKLLAPSEPGAAVSVREDAVVADLHEAFGQDVEEKPFARGHTYTFHIVKCVGVTPFLATNCLQICWMLPAVQLQVSGMEGRSAKTSGSPEQVQTFHPCHCVPSPPTDWRVRCNLLIMPDPQRILKTNKVLAPFRGPSIAILLTWFSSSKVLAPMAEHISGRRFVNPSAE